jgi:hypothetical protein
VADRLTGWQPDPYGVHEFRFFSDDGKATLLVRDRGVTSHDRPPATEPFATPEQAFFPDPEPAHNPEPEPEPEPEVELPASLLVAPTVLTESDYGSVRAKTMTQTPENRAESDGRETSSLTDASDPDGPADNRSTPDDGAQRLEPLSGPRKIVYGVVFAALALSVLGLVYVHLFHKTGTPHATSAVSTTSTSAASKTTTTVALPSALQPGASTAATALVSGWAGGNRATALSVATPSAVGTLFATPYASGMAIDRGCSTSVPPVVCTFGPPGGASPTDPIYQVYVSQTAGGWYVSSVKVEN